MGDVLDGIFKNFGVSGGSNHVKVVPTYLGENEYQKPLEDLMGLLASEANQQRAQRNLMFGGAGYGGSFETAAQKAQRAAGQPVDNSKPFGGWGGYGSTNPVMAWDPTGTRPDWMQSAPPPAAGSAPPTPSPTPPGATAPPTTPPNSAPAPAPEPAPYTPPKSAPWQGEGGFTMDAFLQALQTAMGQKATAPAPAAAADTSKMAGLTEDFKKGLREQYAADGKTPAEVEALVKQRDDQARATQARQAQAGVPKQGTTEFLDWNQQQSIKSLQQQGRTQEAAAAQAQMNSPAYKGYKEIQSFLYSKGDAQGVRQPDVEAALKAGLTVDDLKRHYGAIIDSYGPKAFHYGHTILGQLPDLSPEGIAKIKSGAAAQDAIAAGVNQGLKPGGAKVPGGTAAPTDAAMTATAPPAGADANMSVATAPETSNVTGDKETGAMTWDRFLRVLRYWNPGVSDDDLTSKYKDWYEDGLQNGFDPAWQSDPRFQDLMDIYNPPENPSDEPQRPSQFGQQGFNPTQVQKRDAQGKLMFDPSTGLPIMEDIDPSQVTEGGGYAVGDAWSTSPLWRPEEPTGGLYGAYSEMAGGNLTPYENRIMEGWQGRAANPMGWADDKTLSSIDNYEKTPGRGEDEAYNAYNTMLQGGYSPEEQNAITQEGMRAARAGYETNRDAMLRNQARTNNSAGYAANMAKMARGFGETMGSQGRQNQILFADETQKRRETGAGGMLNVAGLANQRGQTSIQARQGFGNEMARRQETALGGMQQSAGYGRDIQKQGLAGLHALYQGSDPTAAWGQAAEIASKPRETWTKTGGTSGGV